MTEKCLGLVRFQCSVFTTWFLKALAGINKNPLTIIDSIIVTFGRWSNNPCDIQSYSKEVKTSVRLSLGWNVEAKYKGWENLPSLGVCVWDPQVKRSLKPAFNFLLPFFSQSTNSHCTYSPGLTTYPTKSTHLYCWRDKFQWKGITVALDKLVLLKFSHSSEKLHLLVLISDPQNILVWKTGILEYILLPGCIL